jgi:hypothetical protein
VITTPQDNATITGSDVTLNIQISNFAITYGSDMGGMQTEQNQAGTGHVHWYIDVPVPTTPGEMAVTANGTWQMQDGTSYTWHNVLPGTHTFSVELVNKDMTPLSPPVYQTITVITVPGSPVPVNTQMVTINGSSSGTMSNGPGSGMNMTDGNSPGATPSK